MRKLLLLYSLIFNFIFNNWDSNFNSNYNISKQNYKLEKKEENLKINYYFPGDEKVIYNDVINNIKKNERIILQDIIKKEKKLEKYKNIIDKTCKEEWEKYLIQSLIMVESGGNEKAKSKKGAIGLMQLMPCLIEKYKINLNKAYDPKININIGYQELINLIDKYGNLYLALSAYNCGENKLKKIIKKYGKDWDVIKYKLPKQTYAYVVKVLSRYYLKYNNNLKYVLDSINLKIY